MSDAEVDLYREFCLPGQIRAVPNGVDLEYFNNQQSVPARRDNQQSPTTQHAPLTGSDEPSCIFVGALDYHPNVDGATWFCREVWPRIHASCPRAKFLLVGRRPGAGVQRLSAVPGVEVVGQVPDVRPYLARATVAIAPLQIARGIQNKVLEAMAMAKPVIATPQSLVGLRVVPDKHLLCASNADQWQKLVLDLFTNKTGRQQLGRSARRYVEHNHGWDVCLQAFSALLDLEERQECFSQTPGTMPGHSSPSIAVVVSALRFISPDLTAVV
ncbi:MAG: glycosyltransferase [Planctomycetes bacterium]|nr:glycosyltransferase [Planctomycetota bacterium]